MEYPLNVKLLKDGVDKPIITALFSQPEAESSDLCASKNHNNPCFTEVNVTGNNVFWWCGLLASKCEYNRGEVAGTRFSISWTWAIFFIHWGNYTCIVEQNAMASNASISVYGI